MIALEATREIRAALTDLEVSASMLLASIKTLKSQFCQCSECTEKK